MNEELQEGKLRILVEIRHKNDDVTLGFIYTDDDQNAYDLFNNKELFLFIEYLNGEQVFFAKDDIRAFKICDTKNDKNYNIWSFDPYVVLGVDTSITSQALEEVYVALLKKTHPDVIDTDHLHPAFKGLATDMTRRIMSAFEFVRSELSLMHHQER